MHRIQEIWYSRCQFLSDPLKLQLWILRTLHHNWPWKLLVKTKNLFHFKPSSFLSWLFNANMKLQQLTISLNLFQWLSELLKNLKIKSTPPSLPYIRNTKIFLFSWFSLFKFVKVATPDKGDATTFKKYVTGDSNFF